MLEPNELSRQAELNMGRHTNSLLNRRKWPQAYLGYRLGPKWMRGNTEVFNLSDWTGVPLIQVALPKYPGE